MTTILLRMKSHAIWLLLSFLCLGGCDASFIQEKDDELSRRLAYDKILAEEYKRNKDIIEGGGKPLLDYLNSLISKRMNTPLATYTDEMRKNSALPDEFAHYNAYLPYREFNICLYDYKDLFPSRQEAAHGDFVCLGVICADLPTVEILPDFLRPRYTNAVPTLFDLSLGWYFCRDLELEKSAQYLKNKPMWCEMLTSKNPIYRFIALSKAEHYLTEDELIAAYTRALKEYNSLFHGIALEGFKKLNSIKSKPIIEAFLKAHDNDGTWPRGECVMKIGYDALTGIEAREKEEHEKAEAEAEKNKAAMEELGISLE